MIKTYFKGGVGIENPTDADGKEIKEGDILTHSWFGIDYYDFLNKHYRLMLKDEIEHEVMEPSVVVKWNNEGFFYGEGLKPSPISISGMRAYMHDFRFEFTKIVGNIKDNPELYID